MPRPTAQITAITPWSMLGGRGGCGSGIAAIVVEPSARRGMGRTKKFAEPVAVSSTTPTDFPLRPLRAASYSLPLLLRPTPAPCSAQGGMYGLLGHAARVT